MTHIDAVDYPDDGHIEDTSTSYVRLRPITGR